MYKFNIPGLPENSIANFYVCEDAEEADICAQRGYPYLITTMSKQQIIKILLLPSLEQWMDMIDWRKSLGIDKNLKCPNIIVPGDKEEEDKPERKNLSNKEEETSINEANDEASQMADSDRAVGGNHILPGENYKLPLDKYAGDLSSHINIEVLQRLNLLPTFLGDITDCIRKNLGRRKFSRGYNRRRDEVGNKYDHVGVKKNLIILDVSFSIPYNIAACMLVLIQTMRQELSADLIVTGGKSMFFPYEESLPDPQTLRNMIPRSNEDVDFEKIIDTQLRGKQYAHVISFGDADYADISYRENKNKTYIDFTTRDGGISYHEVSCEQIHHYFVLNGHYCFDKTTGYARWLQYINPEAEVDFNTDWCRMIE